MMIQVEGLGFRLREEGLDLVIPSREPGSVISSSQYITLNTHTHTHSDKVRGQIHVGSERGLGLRALTLNSKPKP